MKKKYPFILLLEQKQEILESAKVALGNVQGKLDTLQEKKISYQNIIHKMSQDIFSLPPEERYFMGRKRESLQKDLEHIDEEMKELLILREEKKAKYHEAYLDLEKFKIHQEKWLEAERDKAPRHKDPFYYWEMFREKEEQELP